MTRKAACQHQPVAAALCVDAGVQELNEMTIGRTDDPENPFCAAAFEAASLLGAGSRTPSGPADMAPRQKGRTHDRNRSARQISHFSLASKGPSTHGTEGMAFRGAQANMFDPFDLAWPKLASTLYLTAVGALFAAHIAGFHAIRDTFAAALAYCSRPIRSLAGHTFSLYLFHVPIITFLVAASPRPVGRWQTRCAILLLTPAAVSALARISEDRKDE
jgi:hypothetical protein